MILKVTAPVPPPRVIRQAVAILQRGGIIAFPTDTGYALGCDLFQKKTIDRLYQLKRRPKAKPLSFICADLSELSQFAVVNNQVYRDMRRLLPGPYTFVLPATKLVPRLLVSSRSSVGLRVPDNIVPKSLVEELRHPIVGTSCTDFEGNPLTDGKQIEKTFGKGIDCVLDAELVPSEPSTVIDFSNNVPVILREGKGDISQFNVNSGD